jgi:hypothetical protein
MKSGTKKQVNLTKFLQFYSEHNVGRKTRLGVFDNENDYWIEDGIALSGIDVDSHNNTIEIMLSDVMTHTVKNVNRIKIILSFDELNDGLDITDNDGKTTILRFEN